MKALSNLNLNSKKIKIFFVILSFFIVLMFLIFGLKKEYSALTNSSESAILILDENHIEYSIKDHFIYVLKKDLFKARVLLLNKACDEDLRLGFIDSVFKSLSLNEFSDISYTKLYQYGFEKTIETLEPVKQAMVKISPPRETIFTQRLSPFTMSVVLHLRENAKLSKKELDDIDNFIVCMLPKISKENIIIYNEKGVLLGDYEDDIVE